MWSSIGCTWKEQDDDAKGNHAGWVFCGVFEGEPAVGTKECEQGRQDGDWREPMVTALYFEECVGQSERTYNEN
jgi:hypothetical protein